MLLILVLVVVLVIGLSVSALSHRLRPFALLTTFILLAVLVAWNSFLEVPNEKVAVARLFGKTVPGSYGPGMHLVNPLHDFTKYEALRREFKIAGEVMAADNNTMSLETGFATKLNPAYAWRIQQLVGEDYFEMLVRPAGQTAVRSAVSGFGWAAASTSSRGEVQLAIQRNFEEILVEQLAASGLTPEEARAALVVLPVQLRSALPDQKVQNAVAEKTAAQQDLERQKTLTEIAAQEAIRRKNEGEGVANLFSQLPTGFSPQEISTVLSALATKTRADAMLKAVETGQVDNIIMNGDGSGQIAVQAPAGPGPGAPSPSGSTTEERREKVLAQ